MSVMRSTGMSRTRPSAIRSRYTCCQRRMFRLRCSMNVGCVRSRNNARSWINSSTNSGCLAKEIQKAPHGLNDLIDRIGDRQQILHSTCSSSIRITRSTAAKNNCRLLGKCRYTVPLPTPTVSAKSVVSVLSYPRSSEKMGGKRQNFFLPRRTLHFVVAFFLGRFRGAGHRRFAGLLGETDQSVSIQLSPKSRFGSMPTGFRWLQ